MFKKTLISLAVASSLGLTGCLSGGDEGANANPDYKISNPDFDGKTWPVFNPVTGDLPIPNDLIFDSETGDGTFDVDDTSPPVTTALNELSGASTVAPAVIQFNGQIAEDSVRYGETVFLIELEYASGDPVQGLSSQEPPTVAGLATARADVETLDGMSAIRILPLEPLNPQKRYIAVVTKGVSDINGDAIIASPTYGSLTDEDQPLGTATLAPVRALINGLWEKTAVSSLPITADDIAISYSFTTSNDEKVLQYIAEPGAWFEDQLTTFVKVSAAKAAVAGGAKDYASVKAVVDPALTNFPSAAIKTALSPTFDVAPPQGCGGTTGLAAIQCVSVGLTAKIAAALPTPTPDNRSAADFTLGDPTPVGLVSAVAGSVYDSFNTKLGGSAPKVLAVQGTVSLPYYLGTPESKDGAAAILANSWTADNGIAAGLNAQFEAINLEIPHGAENDSGGFKSNTVNYVFPFPKKQADVDVPALIIYPEAEEGSDTKGVVMFQHGITTDRSTALTFGTALAALGYTVVSIDQPVHGVAAFTAEEQEALVQKLLLGANPDFTEPQLAALTELILAENTDVLAAQLGDGNATPESTGQAMSLINTAKNAGSTVPGLAPMEVERHFGIYSPTPGDLKPIDYTTGEGDSGSMFINLLNFTNTRDNIRQSAVDQMNLRVSLNDLDLTPKGGADLSGANVFFAGHSLGTITGAPFIASVNANQLGAIATSKGPVSSTYNDIEAASMLTPGGGIVRMLENSPSFAPRILLGLQQSAGLDQGDADLESFLNVFQATIDSADPINFADNLKASKPAAYLQSVVQGDAVIPNAADEALWGIAPLDATIPAANTGLPAAVTVDSFDAPLAGSFPLSLMYEDGRDSALFTLYEQAIYGGTTDSEGNPIPLDHGTPVSGSPADAFGQMVLETDGVFVPPAP
ncbi:hypothetical protein HLV39_12130 [Marinobacter adhaerens]|uniref:Bacterial virulence factor lipase N-terminal domain-containing protein n=1 Tax=Marinobacter adhaerens TaxID=1033846 RepID=A0A851I268_9GAMM|nr:MULTISPECIES: hypothetical protein [Marinobacter]NWN92241.1 hypothetical protein [Marinobacter adhaerens]